MKTKGPNDKVAPLALVMGLLQLVGHISMGFHIIHRCLGCTIGTAPRVYLWDTTSSR